MSLAAGEIIDGKYRILCMLGQGGMGAVYEGENLRIRRRVAIKVLHASVSAQEESVRRFEREAQAAARIGSDHICEVLDLGVLPDGTRFMVMEYLDGETLGARLERVGRLAPDRMIPLMAQALDALGAAHAAGIIHRDLKPDNISILPQKAGITDFVKILDFGVSKFSQLSGDEMNVTREGAVVGTPYYMSPEQARGGTVDQRSDIYALGVLLYQATTGQVPFQATTFNELLFKIVLEPAPPPQHWVPDMDPDFAAIIQRAMARDPAHRFQSCAEFKDALLAWLGARPALAAGAHGLRRAVTMRPQTQPLPAMPSPPPGQLSARHGLTPPGQLSAPHGLTPRPTCSPLRSQPAMQPPLTPSGSTWGNASNTGQGLPVPQTSSSWADASGSAPPEKRASRAPIIAIAASALLLLGGGAAAWIALGSSSPDPAPAAPPQAQTAAPTPPPQTAAPTPPTPPPAETAKAPDPVAPVDTAAPAGSVARTAASATPTTPLPRTGSPPVTTYRPPPVKPPPTTKPDTPTLPEGPGY